MQTLRKERQITMGNSKKSSTLPHGIRALGVARVMLLLSMIAAVFMFSSSAQAASIGSQQPNYTECQRYV